MRGKKSMEVSKASTKLESQAILQPADQHPVLIYLASLSHGSRRTMQESLKKISFIISKGKVDFLSFDWASIRYQHTQAVRSLLAEQYKPATANKILSALKGVLKECWRLGFMGIEDYTRAVDVDPVRGSSILKGRALAPGEIKSIMETVGHDLSSIGARDAAIIAVAVSCGLRRAELVKIKMEDLDLASGSLKVRGKGNKERLVYLVKGALSALQEWLEVRGDEEGFIFLPIRKGGKIEHRQMSDQAIYKILLGRAEESNVSSISPHDLRRTFVSEMLDAGADISAVQQLAGHASINTTQKYDRRGERAKKKASELLHVPFFSRKRASVESALQS